MERQGGSVGGVIINYTERHCAFESVLCEYCARECMDLLAYALTSPSRVRFPQSTAYGR